MFEYTRPPQTDTDSFKSRSIFSVITRMNSFRSELLGHGNDKCERASSINSEEISWESMPSISEAVQNKILRALIDIVFDDKIMVFDDNVDTSNVSTFVSPLFIF